MQHLQNVIRSKILLLSLNITMPLYRNTVQSKKQIPIRGHIFESTAKLVDAINAEIRYWYKAVVERDIKYIIIHTTNNNHYQTKYYSR